MIRGDDRRHLKQADICCSCEQHGLNETGHYCKLGNTRRLIMDSSGCVFEESGDLLYSCDAYPSNAGAVPRRGNDVGTNPLLGFPERVCTVVDMAGKHCPDEPAHTVEHDGKQVALCKGCYRAWKEGAYSKPNASGQPRLAQTTKEDDHV